MSEIVLVDCNNFYVSCEQLMDPSLLNKPVCVMSGNNGCIVARSKEAKELGVKMGMPVFMAKKEFKDVIYISGRLGLYGEISQRIMNLLTQYTPTVEVYSIDEAFIDLSGLRNLYRKSYEDIAVEIRNKIKNEIGVPVSIGISQTKVLAKLATDIAKKGDGVYQINSKEINETLKTTNVADVWGIGNSTAALLNKYGIKTAYQLTIQEVNWIKKTLGKRGLELREELLGNSLNPVSSKIELPKSIQKTSSFAKCTNDISYIKNSIHYHAHRACARLRRLEMKTYVVGLMLRTKDFQVISNKVALIKSTNCEFEVYQVIDNLLNKLYEPSISYRSSGVFFENLIQEQEEQLSLFNQNNNKHQKISTLWDKLENKYGKGIIKAGF